MPEWSNGTDSKSVVWVTAPGVRIPLSPQIISAMNPKVDWYFSKNKKWKDEIELLRKIVLDTGIVEDLKCGVPCHTLNGNEIVLIHFFKEYCALLFHKGALLKDKEKILV